MNEGHVFKCGGEELAKVLLYYGLIPEAFGSECKIVCPFHEDVNPSMIVNFDDGSWFCFGCGEAGDALAFVRKLNKDLSDLEACKKYFKILKSKKCESVDFSKRQKIKKQKSFKLEWEIAHDYYYGLKSVDWENDEDEEVVTAREYMNKRGFSPSTLNKCKAKITYNKQYPIIFPMFDEGKFKGWVCRTMSKAVEKRRKYLYNEGFRRKTTLVGKYKGYETVFIVEGYMDSLKFRQFGVHNVVAILGWKMSDEQIKELKDAGIKHVISALDNDECGRKGTKYLERFFNVTRFVYKKNIKDPGEMNEENFKQMLRRTKIKYKQDISIDCSRTSSG